MCFSLVKVILDNENKAHFSYLLCFLNDSVKWVECLCSKCLVLRSGAQKNLSAIELHTPDTF